MAQRIRPVDLNADLVVRVALRWMEVEHEKNIGTFKDNYFVILVFATDMCLHNIF